MKIMSTETSSVIDLFYTAYTQIQNLKESFCFLLFDYLKKLWGVKILDVILYIQ